MEITLNNKSVNIAPDTTIRQLLIDENLPQQNVAVAVNNAIVLRQSWDNHVLADKDNVIVIAAAYGG